MPGLLPDIDPEGLLEFSVVYTDRALNHMSRRFQRVMTDISAILKEVYQADATAIVPGSGSFGMEAVARQFANGQKVLVLRNGFFSFRWSQILEMGQITAPASITVLKARRAATGGSQAPWTPAPIEEVLAAIAREKPAVVFAPHVETASGMMLPDAYMRQIAQATHAAGDGLFVLDCIASGAMWVDMKAIGVDVLLSAPQKGWSSAPGCAMVCLSARARQALEDTASSSFSCDLRKWWQIMQAYESGGHAYHATMPTMALLNLREAMQQTRQRGFAKVREQQIELGRKVRQLFEARGLPSVAAQGFQAPGVVVSYTGDPDIQNASAFAAQGLQTASGVALMCDEPADFRTFRVGLFGLDKWANVDRCVHQLQTALDHMGLKAK
ncbi:MAG: aminotransferase class V-fold PLP-dependent enzyme [Burkholderiaceae bacterium]|nr:aminotransferase class V-fold PLP-dependent enzyme [Burkholderiaceae bacterium]